MVKIWPTYDTNTESNKQRIFGACRLAWQDKSITPGLARASIPICREKRNEIRHSMSTSGLHMYAHLCIYMYVCVQTWIHAYTLAKLDTHLQKNDIRSLSLSYPEKKKQFKMDQITYLKTWGLVLCVYS